MTSKMLEVMGIRSTVTGTIISLQGLSLDVRFGCNGLEAVMIYTVAVIAFPSSWRERFKGILIGFLVIQVISILRILALAYTGIHLKGLFEYIHIYVAQGIMIALALGVFLIYLNLIKDSGKDRQQGMKPPRIIMRLILTFLASYILFLLVWIRIKDD